VAKFNKFNTQKAEVSFKEKLDGNMNKGLSAKD
jgi:hypothetical protein